MLRNGYRRRSPILRVGTPIARERARIVPRMTRQPFRGIHTGEICFYARRNPSIQLSSVSCPCPLLLFEIRAARGFPNHFREIVMEKCDGEIFSGHES